MHAGERRESGGGVRVGGSVGDRACARVRGRAAVCLIEVFVRVRCEKQRHYLLPLPLSWTTLRKLSSARGRVGAVAGAHIVRVLCDRRVHRRQLVFVLAQLRRRHCGTRVYV
jgi:hypothetical protein